MLIFKGECDSGMGIAHLLLRQVLGSAVDVSRFGEGVRRLFNDGQLPQSNGFAFERMNRRPVCPSAEEGPISGVRLTSREPIDISGKEAAPIVEKTSREGTIIGKIGCRNLSK